MTRRQGQFTLLPGAIGQQTLGTCLQGHSSASVAQIWRTGPARPCS